jgi:intraflagellar transport protein 46
MNTKFPSEEIMLDLKDYCQLACNFVDIPVHQNNTDRNLIESLHVLFTLFTEFKQNQHF